LSWIHPGPRSIAGTLCVLALWSICCEKNDSSVVDSTGSAPQLSSASVAPSTVNTDTINVNGLRSPDDILTLSVLVSARVSHADGPSHISSVSFNLGDQQELTQYAAGTLHDNGLDGDSSAGDGIYSSLVQFQIIRSAVGSLRLDISADDPLGYESNHIVLPLTLERLNHPPVLSNLVAPDTVQLANQDQTLRLTVMASDTDGLSDILKVSFNSYKPDNSLTGGSPFLMYDDGQSGGDSKAGDGIYTLTVALPSTTTPGAYRFEFEAVDRSSAVSNVLVHTITIVP